MTFTEYCKQNNIQLLPDDLKFIRQALKPIPKPHQKAVVRRYVDIWVMTMAECKDALRASNEGRRAANEWLREKNDADTTRNR
jgi:hypothetical protein